MLALVLLHAPVVFDEQHELIVQDDPVGGGAVSGLPSVRAGPLTVHIGVPAETVVGFAERLWSMAKI